MDNKKDYKRKLVKDISEHGKLVESWKNIMKYGGKNASRIKTEWFFLI